MTSMSHWAPEQWAVFTVTVAAGVVAATLLALLHRARYRAPALLHARGPNPRPSIVLTERRQLRTAALAADVTVEQPAPAPWPGPMRSRGEWVDPMAADFTDPGIGALASIQALGDTGEMQTSAELDAWINAYADLSGLMPETAKVAETMRVNLEPCLRKARLWRVRGEGGPARQALNDWRIGTDTGEYRMITTSDLRPYAAALLVS